jgi:hypothetical protein
MMRRRCAAWLLAAAFCSFAGCGGSDRPATAPVRGQVTYRGKPVARAVVTFICPGAPRPASGTTDEAGNYQLTTFEPNDGAVVGTHVVTVKKRVSQPEASLPAVDPNATSTDISKAIEQAEKQTLERERKAEKAGSLLPAKYERHQTSNLRKEVAPGENIINIEL